MAITEVSICANALRKLGDNPITSLTDDSERARLMNAMYQETRDSVLRAYPWNFAIARQSLSRELAVPDFGYGYQFILPQEPYCLRALYMYYTKSEFKIEGRKLLTDDEQVNLVYISRVTDTSQFDMLFVQALEARLAAEVSYAVTGSNSLRQEFVAEYMEKLREARSIDAQEGSADAFYSDTLTEVR